VPAQCQLGRSLEPAGGLSREPLALVVLARPRKVGVLGPRGFGIVMRQERRLLVAAAAEALEPRRERRVETGALRLRDARVGDLPGDCVLDGVLALPLDRRPVPATNEVALLEHAQVGLDAFEQLVDGAAPEDAADQRGCLQRRLL